MEIMIQLYIFAGKTNNNMTSIRTYTYHLIQNLKDAGRYSTSETYNSTINSFLQFTRNQDLTFSAITPYMIKEYEEYLLNKGRRHNTLSTYMRMLRSIFNQAMLDGVHFTHEPDELFRYVFTGYEPTTKRAIAPALIRKIAALDLKFNPSLCFSRDVFLLSFYLRGIPFVDLAHLRKSDLRQNNLYYYRQKTKRQLSVFIESCAMAIIKKYSQNNQESPYLLPILKATGEAAFQEYKSALRLYNQHLHRISEILKLALPLTSYVARHSWATTAKNSGIPVSLISESLGHSTEKITHVYLASFDNNLMSEANRKVIKAIISDK